MVYEYALDPEIFARLSVKQALLKGLVEDMSASRGRVVAALPTRNGWLADYVDALEKEKTGKKEVRKFSEIAIELSKHMVKRPGVVDWGKEKKWLDNLASEAGRRPFHAYIGSRKLSGVDGFIHEDQINDNECERWRAPHSITIPRNAGELCRAVEPLLKVSREVLLVDPYLNFRRKGSGYKTVIEEFLDTLTRVTEPGQVGSLELHISEQNPPGQERPQSADDVSREIEETLGGQIPDGLKLEVYRSPIGERNRHNRYVITELAVIEVSEGLDERSKDGDEYSLKLLDRDHTAKVRSRYKGWAAGNKAILALQG